LSRSLQGEREIQVRAMQAMSNIEAFNRSVKTSVSGVSCVPSQRIFNRESRVTFALCKDGMGTR
jgi:hypothetical protein